jgi:hypothetical protein
MLLRQIATQSLVASLATVIPETQAHFAITLEFRYKVFRDTG